MLFCSSVYHFFFFVQAPPKQVPKTIESMRVKDETMVTPEDTEVLSPSSLVRNNKNQNIHIFNYQQVRH